MLELSEETAGAVTILTVKGRIDLATAQELGERLTAALAPDGTHLVLDLRQLDYLSSAGFRVLVIAARRAQEGASRFVLCGLSSKVHQLFDIGGFLPLFEIVPLRDDALAPKQ
jgi:anti-anti-sigma factor